METIVDIISILFNLKLGDIYSCSESTGKNIGRYI
jgi:hypothetical protein